MSKIVEVQDLQFRLPHQRLTELIMFGPQEEGYNYSASTLASKWKLHGGLDEEGRPCSLGQLTHYVMDPDERWPPAFSNKRPLLTGVSASRAPRHVSLDQPERGS